MRKFFRQIVGTHVPIGRDQDFLLSVFNERQKARPLVAHPDGGEILRSGAEYDHNFGTIEGGEDVWFILRAELVLQRDA